METNTTLQQRASKAFMFTEKASGFIYYSTGAHLAQKLNVEKTVVISYNTMFLVGACVLLAMSSALLYWRYVKNTSYSSEDATATHKKGKSKKGKKKAK